MVKCLRIVSSLKARFHYERWWKYSFFFVFLKRFKREKKKSIEQTDNTPANARSENEP